MKRQRQPTLQNGSYDGPREQGFDDSLFKLVLIPNCGCDGVGKPLRSRRTSPAKGTNLPDIYRSCSSRCGGHRRRRQLARATAGAMIVALSWQSRISAAVAVGYNRSSRPSTLWDVVSTDPDYSMLASCLESADSALVGALKRSDKQPLTLFAPCDSGFERMDWSRHSGISPVSSNDSIFDVRCHDEESATALLSYHVSTTTAPTPYIGLEFKTMLGENASAHFYGIAKSTDVPASSFPIQFVDASNVTSAPVKIGDSKSYLFPMDRVLRPPVGTIWKTLQSDPSFSRLVAALDGTELARTLDTQDAISRYTLFAPDDEAIEASQSFPEDPAALEVLMSFHTLAKGSYPQSVNGAHFSPQLFKVDPAGGTLSRDYYREFYAEAFVGGQVTSLAGPLLNVTRAPVSLAGSPFSSYTPRAAGATPTALLVEGVPVSEADIAATNGVVHRLSVRAMAAPATATGVLLDPPFPLSSAGAFEAVGELVRLAWPLVNETLTGDGPLTVLAPTDAAFDLAIAAGQLPPRPWDQPSSTILKPEAAARLLLSHTLRTPDGPLLFSPTAADPFASGFVSGDRFATAASPRGVGGDAAVGAVEVEVRLIELGTRSATTGSADVADRVVYVDNARVTQCVDKAGVGHDCGSKPRPSNTFALNGPKLCVVHAVDRVLFPPDPETDLAEMLDANPFLSRFSHLLKEHGLLQAAVSSARVEGRGEGLASTRFTVFAPTNDALTRLEGERPWLFENSTTGWNAALASEGSAGDGGGGDNDGVSTGGRGAARGGKGWSPVRELLAYHLVPGDGMFSRYFNESYRRTQTLALDGQAPIDVRFTSANGTCVFPEAEPRPGNGSEPRAGALGVNLQACSAVDASASNGVLHVLAFHDRAKVRGDDIIGLGGAAASGDGVGVLVPDVLELAFAFGYRGMYEAIVDADGDAAAAGASTNAEDGVVSEGTDDDVIDFPSTVATGRRATETAVAKIATGAGKASMVEALRGSAQHTLLVVADSWLERRSSCLAGEVATEISGLSADTFRYQTLIGDQELRLPGSPSSKLETLLGTDAHAFNNSENPGNPFVPTNGTGLCVDQSQVISAAGMVALNGRIHEISESLRAPATDLFTLLSSRPELSGWTNWVQESGLAELLADPAAGPFTVFAPLDASLEMIPGLLAISADTRSLANLVRFHVAVGAVDSAEGAGATNIGAGGRGSDDGTGGASRGEGNVNGGNTSNNKGRGRLFTPTLANATSEERSALAGERFVSGRPLRTLLGADAPTLVVQIAAAGEQGSHGKARSGDVDDGGTVRVFVGPGRRREVGRESGGVETSGGAELFLGAFAAEVVLPNLNAVNGVVHGISGIMTYPGYRRPAVPFLGGK